MAKRRKPITVQQPNTRARMATLTVSSVLLAAALCVLMVRVDPTANAGHPVWFPFALLGAAVVSIAYAAYWGFSPLIRQRGHVAKVIEQTLGIKPGGLETLAEATQRKKFRQQASKRFIFKVVATGFLASVAISIHHVFPRQPLWLGAAIFYCGMITWELVFSHKQFRDRAAHASFWALLFLTSFGGDVLPSESVWKTVTPLIGLVALAVVAWRQADAIPSQSMHSVMEAYRKGDYQLALERTDKIDPAFNDRFGEFRIRATIHYRRQEFDEAEIMVRKALVAQWDARRASQLLVLVSSVLLEKGQYSEAGKALDGASELDRLNGSVDRIRALLLLRQGLEPVRALELSQKALVCPENEKGLALAVRAWALGENGREAEARTAIEHAWDLPSTKASKPDMAEIAFYAGQALRYCAVSISSERYFIKSVEADPHGLFGALSNLALQNYQTLETREELFAKNTNPISHPT